MFHSEERLDRYLSHLDRISGGARPMMSIIDSTTPGHPGVMAIAYPDELEDGFLVGFTYGLSVVHHDAWAHGARELCVAVTSRDIDWVSAIATIAEHFRHQSPFLDGDRYSVDHPIVPETDMDGFVVAPPLVLEKVDTRLDVGDGHPLQIAAMIPTYASERRLVATHGLSALGRLGIDFSDVRRPPAAGTGLGAKVSKCVRGGR